MTRKKIKPIAVAEPSLLDLQIRKLSPRQRKSRAYNAAKHLVKEGYEVNHEKLWFQTGLTSLNEIPTPARYYARQLLRLGYYHQIKLI
jgi:hypothetical protein